MNNSVWKFYFTFITFNVFNKREKNGVDRKHFSHGCSSRDDWHTKLKSAGIYISFIFSFFFALGGRLDYVSLWQAAQSRRKFVTSSSSSSSAEGGTATHFSFSAITLGATSPRRQGLILTPTAHRLVGNRTLSVQARQKTTYCPVTHNFTTCRCLWRQTKLLSHN